MTSMAEAAVLLAERGSRVFPVGADKAPRTARGFHDASSDLTQVWGWEQLGLFEGGGIGLVIPPRVFVVDVDPRNGGLETMGTLCASYGPLPTTRTVRTQSRGEHLYFALPDDRDLRGSLGPGVDIKKPGRGYVLVPPSPGYTFLRGGKPAPAPDWLLDELTVSRTRADGDASKPKFFPFMGGTGYGLAALRNAVERVRVLEEGGRRAAINREAFCLAQLVAGGELDEDKALEALLEAALECGLSEKQAVSRMKSGWAAGLAKPWSAE